MRFTKIPEDLFETVQPNAGVILSAFDPENPPTAEEMMQNIKGATSGGVNIHAAPTYSDQGEGIDNCPRNMMELKQLDGWEITMSGTYLTVTIGSAKELAGPADVDGDKLTLRNQLKTEDFSDIWWVGDYSNKNSDGTGGYVAIHMMNALSTGGFQIQSSDKKKGQFAFTYTAHYSINDQNKVPFEIYIQAGEGA